MSEATTPAPAAAAPAPSTPPAPAAGGASAPTVTPPAPADFATQLASMKRKERELHGKQETWKAERAKADADIAAQKAALEKDLAAVAEWRKARENAAANPVALLEAHGVSFDQASEFILAGNKPTPEMVNAQVEHRIAALRKELADKDAEAAAAKKAAEDKARADQEVAENAAVERWTQQTTDAVVAAGDKYEFLNLLGIQFQVADAIKDLHASEGKFMPWEEAAEKLENYYRGLWEKGLESKWYKSRGVAPKPADGAVPPPEKRDEAVPETLRVVGERDGRSRVPVSLSNELTPTTSATPSGGDRWAQIKAAKGWK